MSNTTTFHEKNVPDTIGTPIWEQDSADLVRNLSRYRDDPDRLYFSVRSIRGFRANPIVCSSDEMVQVLGAIILSCLGTSGALEKVKNGEEQRKGEAFKDWMVHESGGWKAKNAKLRAVIDGLPGILQNRAYLGNVLVEHWPSLEKVLLDYIGTHSLKFPDPLLPDDNTASFLSKRNGKPSRTAVLFPTEQAGEEASQQNYLSSFTLSSGIYANMSGNAANIHHGHFLLTPLCLDGEVDHLFSFLARRHPAVTDAFVYYGVEHNNLEGLSEEANAVRHQPQAIDVLEVPTNKPVLAFPTGGEDAYVLLTPTFSFGQTAELARRIRHLRDRKQFVRTEDVVITRPANNAALASDLNGNMPHLLGVPPSANSEDVSALEFKASKGGLIVRTWLPRSLRSELIKSISDPYNRNQAQRQRIENAFNECVSYLLQDALSLRAARLAGELKFRLDSALEKNTSAAILVMRDKFVDADVTVITDDVVNALAKALKGTKIVIDDSVYQLSRSSVEHIIQRI